MILFFKFILLLLIRFRFRYSTSLNVLWYLIKSHPFFMDAYIITGNAQNWVNTRLNQHFPRQVIDSVSFDTYQPGEHTGSRNQNMTSYYFEKYARYLMEKDYKKIS